MKVETNPQVSPGFGADDAVGPVATAVGLLKAVDRAMAGVLRAIAISQPEAGMPADRLISLAASATGWDVAYLARATDVLDCMPATWQAFDEGRLSWSQLRGIIAAAKRLSRDDRAQLDWRLTGAISHNPDGEPDALVEHAHTIATQLTDQRTADAELSSTRRQFVRFQPDLFGGVDFWGFADELTAATMKAAMDAAADAPRLADEPSVDNESQPMPATWSGYSSRDGQLLEGLRRVCVAYLAGASGDDPDSIGQSRPDMHVVVDIAQLLKACDSDGVGLVTSRALWSMASGRTAASHGSDLHHPPALPKVPGPAPATLRTARRQTNQPCPSEVGRRTRCGGRSLQPCAAESSAG